MNKFLKLAALFIVLTMLACCISVFAYSFTDISEYDEAVALLSKIGVVKGYSETEYGPSTRVSRWQMALFITRAVTGKVNDKIWSAEANGIHFTDIGQHHYKSAIAYAFANEIIAGRSKTLFDPDSGITLQEGVTMAVRALGYPPGEYDPKWPEGYIKKGKALGLYKGLENISDTSTLNRKQTARLVYNMLFAERFSGENLAFVNFCCVSGKTVLTSTDSSYLLTGGSYSQSGKLGFALLDNMGNLLEEYTIDASIADIKDAHQKIGHVYTLTGRVLGSTIEEIYLLEECSFQVFSSSVDVDSNNSTITLEGRVYETVSAYASQIEEGVTPFRNQIILYGLNGETGRGKINASRLEGKTSHCKIIAFDINGDGNTYDYALVIPYSFGKYDENKYSGYTKTGEGLPSLAHGRYMLYSADPAAKTLDVRKVYAEFSGVITAYNPSSRSVTFGSVIYNIGDNELPGAYYSQIYTSVYSAYAVKENTKVYFIAEGNKLLAVLNPFSYSERDYAVISDVFPDGRVKIFASNAFAEMTYFVSTVDGKIYEYSQNGNAISTGDFLEYSSIGEREGYISLDTGRKADFAISNQAGVYALYEEVGKIPYYTIKDSDGNGLYSVKIDSSTSMVISNTSGIVTGYYTYENMKRSMNNLALPPYTEIFIAGSGKANMVFVRMGGAYNDRSEFESIVYIGSDSQKKYLGSDLSGNVTYLISGCVDLSSGLKTDIHLKIPVLQDNIGIRGDLDHGFYRVSNERLISHSKIISDVSYGEKKFFTEQKINVNALSNGLYRVELADKTLDCKPVLYKEDKGKLSSGSISSYLNSPFYASVYIDSTPREAKVVCIIKQ